MKRYLSLWISCGIVRFPETEEVRTDHVQRYIRVHGRGRRGEAAVRQARRRCGRRKQHLQHAWCATGFLSFGFSIFLLRLACLLDIAQF